MSASGLYSSLVHCSLNMLLKHILSWWDHVHFPVLVTKHLLSCFINRSEGTSFTMQNNYWSLKNAQSQNSNAELSLSWEIKELKTLNTKGCNMYSPWTFCMYVSTAVSLHHFELHNIPRKLVPIGRKLLNFVKRTVYFRRTPATHIFVFMLSSDRRDKNLMHCQY